MVFIILINRNIVEILNLDSIKGTSYISEEDYGFDVLIQVGGTFMMVLLYFNMYRGSKVHLFVVFLMSFVIFYCCIVSQYGDEWINQGIIALIFKHILILGL